MRERLRQEVREGRLDTGNGFNSQTVHPSTGQEQSRRVRERPFTGIPFPPEFPISLSIACHAIHLEGIGYCSGSRWEPEGERLS